MRELLLTAALLHSVVAQFEGEKSYRSTSNGQTQSWPIKLIRLPWDDVDHNFLPSIIVVNSPEIDHADLPSIQLKNLQDLRKVTRYRSRIVKKQPIVIIMYEDQESIDDRLGSGRIRRENQGWTIQEPLYVQEPSWIMIEDNEKSFGKMSKENDPFFVTRGKKVFTVKENESTEGTTRYYNNIVRSQRGYSSNANKDDANAKILRKGSKGSWNPEVNFSARRFNENPKYPYFVEYILKNLEKSLYQENAQDSQDDLVAKNLEGRSIFSKISLMKTDTKENYPRGPAERLKDEGVTNVMEREREKRSVNFKRTITNDLKDLLDVKKDLEKRTNYKLKNEELREIIRNAIFEQGEDFKDLNFLQLRNKHSNILDIFDEPFFISRGKKNMPNSNDPFNDRITEKFSPSKSNYEYFLRNFENWKFSRDPRDKRSKTKPPRNRRGMLDDILMRYDPFYIARGKRITSRAGIFEKLKKFTDTDAVKFFEGDKGNWSNAKNDPQASKELQEFSSITKNNILEENDIRNTNNLNNYLPGDSNNIENRKTWQLAQDQNSHE